MKRRIPTLDGHINEGLKKPFVFKVKSTQYTMYNSIGTKNGYEVYRFDEDYGPMVIRFNYSGKGKIDFRYSSDDIYTNVDFNDIMYAVMKHLKVGIKSNLRRDIDSLITYNT
ncbi:MAG TPA: hypothetical protein P5509_09140 [Bacteroidales bacterium]|nr:hypothetical protein [Bacteroidales bacterium]